MHKKKNKNYLKWLILCLTMIFLTSCSLPGLGGKSKDTIRIASGSTTEYNVMASMLKYMIEYYTDEKVEIISNLGSTTVIHNAMMNDDADVSAIRFTGTDVSSTLQLPAEKDPKKAYSLVKKEFQKRYDQTYWSTYGFADTYAFMVTKKTAEKYHLKKISDLKPYANKFVAGVDTSWMDRPGDGYKGFVKEYGFDFKQVYPMQIGLVYDAVAAGKMDVVLGYSTDGRINDNDLVVLEDDLHFFPPYDACIVVNNQVLKEHPQLKKAFDKLVGKIDTKQMQKLNSQGDSQLIEPDKVAEDFLKKHHFFDEKGD